VRRLVAVARGAGKLERIQALGPDAVIDSEAGDWVAGAREAIGGTADVVLDNVGGVLGADAASLLGDNGRFSAHGTPSGALAQIETDAPGARVTGIDLVQLDSDARRRSTSAALVAVTGGELAPIIGQTFPLEQAAAAHAAIEARTVLGKTLLTSRDKPMRSHRGIAGFSPRPVPRRPEGKTPVAIGKSTRFSPPAPPPAPSARLSRRPPPSRRCPMSSLPSPARPPTRSDTAARSRSSPRSPPPREFGSLSTCRAHSPTECDIP
jgi:hypothetical protein